MTTKKRNPYFLCAKLRRSERFKDRKKERGKRLCRKKVQHEDL